MLISRLFSISILLFLVLLRPIPSEAKVLEIPHECSGFAESIISLFRDGTLDDYPKNYTSASTQASIQEILEKSKTVPACFTWSVRVYAASSLGILFHEDPRTWNDTHDSIAHYHTFNKKYLATMALANEMIFSNRVMPISTLEPEKLNLERNQLVGAYECDPGIIYLDPSLKVHDLGAVFAHELEHLLLDKGPLADQSLTTSSSAEDSIAEEVSAALVAAWYEYRIPLDIYRPLENKKYSGNEIDWIFKNYSFASSDGLIDNLVRHELRHHPIPFNADLTQVLNEKTLDRSYFKKSILKLIHLVAGIYYPNQTINESLVATKIKVLITFGSGTGPALAKFNDLYTPFFVEHYPNTYYTETWDKTFIFQYATNLQIYSTENSRFPFDFIDSVSPQCLAAAKGSGERVKGSGEGVKGSGEGVKGSHQKVKACLKGLKF